MALPTHEQWLDRVMSGGVQAKVGAAQ